MKKETKNKQTNKREIQQKIQSKSKTNMKINCTLRELNRDCQLGKLTDSHCPKDVFLMTKV
jgi:hypothetical protein